MLTLSEGQRFAGRIRMKRGRPKPMSDKRRREIPIRDEVRYQVLGRDRDCVLRSLVPEVTCSALFEVHEPETRARFPGRKAWLNPNRCITLCGNHHGWVTRDLDRKATAIGLSIHEGDPDWSAEVWRAEHLAPRVQL